VGIRARTGSAGKSKATCLFSTNTDRYTDPVPVKYTVENLTDKTLAIKADDYLSGVTRRTTPSRASAQAMARHDGQALYRQRLRVHEIRGRERAQYKKTEKTLGPEKKGWEKRKLVLWTEDGKPVRLTFTEPDDAGKMKWQTAVYYLGGQINYYKGPFSGYIFKNGRLVLGVDGDMKPLSGITGEDMKKTTSAIEKRSAQYLALFDLGK
jgi:hypothetical protein